MALLPYVVVNSANILTRDEALDYVAARITATYDIAVAGGRTVKLTIEKAVHCFTEGAKGQPIAPADLVLWPKKHFTERRRFSLDRAIHLDLIVPVVRNPPLIVSGTSQEGGGNVLLFGPALTNGRRMKVVVQRLHGDVWLCVSAFPVGAKEAQDAARSKRVPWPP